MALTQAHWHPDARAYLERRKDAGDTPKEALRALKRRLSDVVYRALLADADSPAAPSNPRISQKPLDIGASYTPRECRINGVTDPHSRRPGAAALGWLRGSPVRGHWNRIADLGCLRSDLGRDGDMNRTNWADRASGATCVVRASYGSVLVVGPGWVITRAGGRPTRRVEVVARVLGVRHIIQAAVQLWLGPGRTAVAGAAVDALHAMSMVLVRDNRRRRRKIGFGGRGSRVAVSPSRRCNVAPGVTPRIMSVRNDVDTTPFVVCANGLRCGIGTRDVASLTTDVGPSATKR